MKKKTKPSEYCPCDTYVDGDVDPACPKHGIFLSTPPAEPDSGVQEKECNGDGCPGCPDCRNDSGLPDAPSESVNSARQKTRDVCPFCKAMLELAATKSSLNALRLLAESRRQEILSLRRSNSPASGVSASPDSAPWTVIHYEHPQKIWQIWQGDKHITNSTDGDALTILADAHNATLPAPRSGSEVSGVSSLEELITELKNRLDSQFFILSAPGTDGRTLVDFTSRLYVTDYSPSAPSSTEQKGT